jgi:hypothetical protein
VAYVKQEAEKRGIKLTPPKFPACGSIEVKEDRAGNGGHSNLCQTNGKISFGLCKQRLSDSHACTALTYKHGECYLHDRGDADHWSDKTEGALYGIKFVPSLEKCAGKSKKEKVRRR